MSLPWKRCFLKKEIKTCIFVDENTNFVQKYKLCIFQMGIGTLEVYPIGYQLLRKLDCLQTIRILRMIIPMVLPMVLMIIPMILRLWKGLILERKLPWVKIYNTITQLNNHDSLSPFLQKVVTTIFWFVWGYTYYISLRKLYSVAAFSMTSLFLFAWCHIWTYPVWLNDWVFVYEVSGCRFESHCVHLKQGVPWHWGNFRV